MQKRESKYERIILALVALAAVAVAGWFIYLRLGFADTLKTPVVPLRNESVAPPLAQVDDAIKRAIETPKPWVAPMISGKPVPLNKSVLLAIRGDEIIDLFTETNPFRAPMTNAFLRENNLDWQYPNVGDLDPDDDGYSNLEEFNKNTKPKDAQSHPPLTDKLFMAQRLSKDYRIVLRNSTGQINLPDESGTGPNRKNYFLDVSKVGVPTEKPQFFGGVGDRFKTVKWEAKKMADPRLGEKDVSELTVEEIVTKRQIVLVVGVEQNLAEYSVVFQFRLKQIIDLAPVAKGGSFRIPGHEETTYRVLDIQEDKAVISPLDATGNPGPEIIINRG